MKSVLPLMLIAGNLGCVAQPELDLNTILARNAAAHGGEAFESLHAVRLQAQITEPAFQVTGDYVAMRDDRMRVDIFAEGERVFTEALGPEGGWQRGGDDSPTKGVNAEGEGVLRRGLIAKLYPLARWPEHGFVLEYAGEVPDGSGRAHAIDVTGPTGFHRRLLIDPHSFRLIAARETSALHPDLDPTKSAVETRFEDYRWVDGILISHRSVKRDVDTDAQLQEVVILDAQVNPVLDPRHFEPPQAAP